MTGHNINNNSNTKRSTSTSISCNIIVRFVNMIFVVPLLWSFLSLNFQRNVVVLAGTNPDDLKWLDSKKLEPGVVETSSGLLYKGMCVNQYKKRTNLREDF